MRTIDLAYSIVLPVVPVLVFAAAFSACFTSHRLLLCMLDDPGAFRLHVIGGQRLRGHPSCLFTLFWSMSPAFALASSITRAASVSIA
jgi:hypothetical protein